MINNNGKGHTIRMDLVNCMDLVLEDMKMVEAVAVVVVAVVVAADVGIM